MPRVDCGTCLKWITITRQVSSVLKLILLQSPNRAEYDQLDGDGHSEE